jgi:hypothetical protein
MREAKSFIIVTSTWIVYDITQDKNVMITLKFLLLTSLTVLGYFYRRFYIGGGITVFRVLLNLGYSWEVFNGCRDLSK